MTIGKRTKAIREGVDREKSYLIAEAVKLVKERAKAKFDETIGIADGLRCRPIEPLWSARNPGWPRTR